MVFNDLMKYALRILLFINIIKMQNTINKKNVSSKHKFYVNNQLKNFKTI